MKKVFLNINYICVLKNFLQMYELHQVRAKIFNKLLTYYEIYSFVLKKVLNSVV